MKLPKCPHCDKLMASQVVRAEIIGDGARRAEMVVEWLCPEKAEFMYPTWVDVEERNIG